MRLAKSVACLASALAPMGCTQHRNERISAADLFNLAFGNRWLDAYLDREATVKKLADRMQKAIRDGGKVWVAEAGQSEVTAAAVNLVPEMMWTSIHVVQHGSWNESQTGTDTIQRVIYNTRYHRIPGGNFPDNGSPAFNARTHSIERT